MSDTAVTTAENLDTTESLRSDDVVHLQDSTNVCCQSHNPFTTEGKHVSSNPRGAYSR